MYWYISFLRPPPVSVNSTTKEITITPQVANDLRTELRYEPTTIQYVWQKISPITSTISPPQELTVFSPPQSTYKPISIPLPTKIQIGDSWRLGLFCSDSPRTKDASNKKAGPSSSLLSLCEEDDVGVLGVWSEGINIIRPEIFSNGVMKGINGKNTKSKEKHDNSKKDNGKGKGKEKEKDDGPKQGRITRDFTLPKQVKVDNDNVESMLRIIEQTSFDLDKKIWDSGLALSSWFWKYLPENQFDHDHNLANEVINLIRSQNKLDILELGSGTGLVSIALSLALKRYLPKLQRNVVTTDLESAIPLMTENLLFNSLENSEDGSIQIDAKVLDWDQELPSYVSESWPELIIAADVTYNTSAFPSLLRTITSLLNPLGEIRTISVSQDDEDIVTKKRKRDINPILVLAYKQRDLAERDLWEMLKQENIQMVLVDRIKGAEEEGETEIWIGKYV
ncbi:uncharacterized protein L201_002685 [Kwoniella dendrophila CBS 6074]|uniref:Methyltransferase-domain-containing protein n=1 Tax=Kwoniella dendrophila CBS 6074 TaxID=1295534 RepID=A0AAX4JTH9_9TREE